MPHCVAHWYFLLSGPSSSRPLCCIGKRRHVKLCLWHQQESYTLLWGPGAKYGVINWIPKGKKKKKVGLKTFIPWKKSWHLSPLQPICKRTIRDILNIFTPAAAAASSWASQYVWLFVKCTAAGWIKMSSTEKKLANNWDIPSGL